MSRIVLEAVQSWQHFCIGAIMRTENLKEKVALITGAVRGIGGGCRFPDTPFVIGENKNTSHD
jgi:hypothetical protein